MLPPQVCTELSLCTKQGLEQVPAADQRDIADGSTDNFVNSSGNSQLQYSCRQSVHRCTLEGCNDSRGLLTMQVWLSFQVTVLKSLLMILPF